MSVYNVLYPALYSKLTAGTTVTALLAGTTAIYDGIAPPNAAKPYVVLYDRGGGQQNITPGNLVSKLVEITAFASGATGRAVAGTIDAAVSALLHQQSLTVSGWSNYWLSREQDVVTDENEPTTTPVFGRGAYYRVELSEE